MGRASNIPTTINMVRARSERGSGTAGTCVLRSCLEAGSRRGPPYRRNGRKGRKAKRPCHCGMEPQFWWIRKAQISENGLQKCLRLISPMTFLKRFPQYLQNQNPRLNQTNQPLSWTNLLFLGKTTLLLLFQPSFGHIGASHLRNPHDFTFVVEATQVHGNMTRASSIDSHLSRNTIKDVIA
jgi:hypothetical protein